MVHADNAMNHSQCANIWLRFNQYPVHEGLLTRLEDLDESHKDMNAELS